MKNSNLFLIVFSLFFSLPSFSFKQSEASKKYDNSSTKKINTRSVEKKYGSEFKSNLKKYKTYSPSKKKRYKTKWSSFKKNSGWGEMTPEQKKKLREKVLKKKKSL